MKTNLTRTLILAAAAMTSAASAFGEIKAAATFRSRSGLSEKTCPPAPIRFCKLALLAEHN
jgi:hypothetical protein